MQATVRPIERRGISQRRSREKGRIPEVIVWIIGQRRTGVTNTESDVSRATHQAVVAEDPVRQKGVRDLGEKRGAGNPALEYVHSYSSK